MVNRTRTSDGTIARANYDYPTLRLKGEASSSTSPRSPRTEYRRRARIVQGNHIGIKAAPKLPRSNVDIAALTRFIPELPPEDITQGVNFIPQTAFGEYQAEGLSAIEHAERRIAQWEIVREAHAQHLPRVLPLVDERLRDAREKLQNLLDDEGNLQANSSAS